MELELTTSDGGGYISVLSNGVSLVCKPVSSNEIRDLVDDFEKNKKFRVSSYGSSDGNERHIVKEKIDRNYQPMGSVQQPQKSDLEFARFKQDCRKRALDLAHTEIQCTGSHIVDGKLTKVTDLANEYYEWLIKEV